MGVESRTPEPQGALRGGGTHLRSDTSVIAVVVRRQNKTPSHKI